MRLIRTMVTIVLATFAAGIWLQPVLAKTDPTQILQTAIKNTDTVKTLIYTNVQSEQKGNVTVTSLIQGQEDEVGNKEADRQVLSEATKGKNGKVQQRAYAIDIIFLGGNTYYQYPLKDKAWHVQAGMQFQDKVSGSTWKRGRTTVPSLKGVKLTAKSGPNGTYSFTGTATINGFHGTVNVVISGGSKPYVTTLSEVGTVTAKTGSFHLTSRWSFGPFNTTLNIKAPVNSA